METHYEWQLSINEAPLKGEMSVLFSGQGKPVEGHFIGPAVHDYYLLHVVLDGEGVFETLGESYKLSAGDAFVIFPDILVRYEASRTKPWSYMWVAFDGEGTEQMLRGIGIAPDNAVIRACPLTRLRRQFLRIRRSIGASGTPALSNLEASAWLRMVLTDVGRVLQDGSSGQTGRADHAGMSGERAVPYSGSGHRSFRSVDQAIRLLTLQFGQYTSIDQIARTLGYHRSHLTKLFKDATGMSPMQYLYKVRMKKAETLLASDLTVAQVAASVGYNDPLFFTKQFRKWSGKSPTAFRKHQAERE
ncbi:AraC family transcriptional regulator [Paenibacillus nanensis]|uniref:AraC family transcriptional regulator n=1 Tax=Paenibacillus nanensis TaxID=393251 RepID=A0A3A1UXB4_9BACL|nr:AraC family transcriptional regulator [Paenibacillus nanensis]RIX52346.1 AraC family transcriptional regulator [Paenibacillus nanensis]